jgi:hypothetical protein
LRKSPFHNSAPHSEHSDALLIEKTTISAVLLLLAFIVIELPMQL